MFVSISRPELLSITDGNTGELFFGANQEWYYAQRSRRAGCGPTCAANILAYLALSHPKFEALYGYDNMNLCNFTQHMEEVYKFVTPGGLGLHRTEMFSDGVANFARSRGILLHPHVFCVPGNMKNKRPDIAEFIEFAKAGLASDCPLGFLNLTRGSVKALQSWHWITITEVNTAESSIIAYASDEGKKISFDLRQWYLSTRWRGGLVYFS